MNLYELWHLAEDTDLCNVLNAGDNVQFNGEEFSDDYCFDKGNSYEVLEVEPSCMKLRTKFLEGETTVYVYELMGEEKAEKFLESIE